MPSLTTRAQVSLQGGTLQTYFDIRMLQSEILAMSTLYFMSKHVYIVTLSITCTQYAGFVCLLFASYGMWNASIMCQYPSVNAVCLYLCSISGN